MGWLSKPSIMARIAIGKGVGLAVGLIAFFLLPVIWPGSDPSLRWGVLLWYTTMGGVIGVFGVMTYHPVLHLPMPWWARSALVGAWFNFVLTFFAHQHVRAMLEQVFGAGSIMTSPYWLVVVGMVVGWLMGLCATRFGGEGPETVREIERAAINAQGKNQQ